MNERTQGQLEFWFDFGSNYSYLSVLRIRAAAHAAGVQVAWRPFLLGPVFQSLGWSTSPFLLQKEKGAYVWQDMARLCRKYGLPWRQPATFPRASLLPARVAMYGAGAPWLEEFCVRVMQRNFADDLDIDGEQGVAAVLKELGLDSAPILAGARSEACKLALRARTEQARTRGVFGAPTFFVGQEMYWGNDRMEDALEHARSSRTD